MQIANDNNNPPKRRRGRPKGSGDGTKRVVYYPITLHTKKCFKCEEVKPAIDFNSNYRIIGGLGTYCRQCNAAYSKAYMAANLEARKKYHLAWRAANPHKEKEYTRRRLSTAKGKINNAIRCRVWQTIKSGSKNGANTFQLLGYSCQELIEHLEKQFEPWMSWDNHGEWHIDHKIPVSAFNYNTPYDLDFRRCWALDNLRPLAANDNLIKKDKVEGEFQPSFAFG